MNHRFGSSGLNLAFEGLLLRVRFCLRAKATSSNPYKSDSHNAREAPLCFVGNRWHCYCVTESRRYRRSLDESLGRRQGESFRSAKAKDASQRWRASYYPKAAVSSPAHVSILLEAL
jgi:hypothetical protein